MSPPTEKGKGKEAELDPPAFRPFSRWRMNPRPASGDGAWEDAPPLFLQFQKDFPAIAGVFRGCFVIFKLFNVIIFVLF